MLGITLDPNVLRKYDIRGIVGDQLCELHAEAIGRTFGSIVSETEGNFVCIGRDGRLSSPALAGALIAGLRCSGMHVVDIGLATTPMLYFVSKMLDSPGAIMVTGSHNPPSYNGFKLLLRNSPFWSVQIQDLGQRSAEGKWQIGKGNIVSLEVLNAYVTRVLVQYETKKEMKVVWDAGNAAVGPSVVKLVESLPGEHIVLNEAVDGNFPSHHPDPTIPENLKQLIDTVIGLGYDLGIAFDGDGDRIGVIDDKGSIVWGDQLLAIYASELLCRHPGAEIIADVKASQVLFDEVKRLGGIPVMSATGHSVIKSLMADSGALLAGEMSGHIFFADQYYGYDDALYSAVRLLDILAKTEKPLSELVSAMPQVMNTPEIRIEVPEERKFLIVDKVLAKARDANLDINCIDGLRVSGPDGWWLLRASNTENALVVRCEAFNNEGLIAMKGTVRRYLRELGIQMPL